MNIFKELLICPLTRGEDIDSPHCTELRRTVIQKKPFLRQLYEEWYESIADSLPPGKEPVLELGSGGGFLSDFIPGLMTSEIFCCKNVRAVLDGCRLPFAGKSLRAIVMTDVFHHLSEPEQFFAEAAFCMRPSGVIVMIEPWLTTWSCFVYSRFHHEPFLPESREWSFSKKGPLSGANGALPWIVFERDRSKFERDFPGWRIASVRLIMPFRYLLSGGVSLRSLMPGWTFPLWRDIEKLLQPWMRHLAMFALIVLVREP